MEAATVAELRAARKLQQQKAASAKRAAREARRAENIAIHNAKRPRVPSNLSVGSGKVKSSNHDSINGDRSPCLRVCVVGLGWYALRAHLPALAALESRGFGMPGQHIKVVALVSSSADAHAAAERRLGHSATWHTSLAAALADPQLDVIDLVLPTPKMPAAIEACLAAGKCMVSEKPAAPSLVDVATLFGAWRRAPSSAHWSVSEQWGHKPAVGKLRSLLDRGAVGPAILGFRFVHEQPICEASDGGRDSWRTALQDEGSDTTSSLPWLRDVGVHFVRALRTMLGPVTAVHPGSTQGAMPVNLELESGIRGTLQLTFPLVHADDGTSNVSKSNSSDSKGYKTGSNSRNDDADVKLDRAQFLVWGSKGCLAWDFKQRSIEFRAPSKATTLHGGAYDDACVGSYVVQWRETVGSDSFIEGGVRAALAECLRDAAYHRRRNRLAAPRNTGSDHHGVIDYGNDRCDDNSGGFAASKSSNGYSNCSPEAAAHDMAVIRAIEKVLSNANSHTGMTAPVSPSALLAAACAAANLSDSSSSSSTRKDHDDCGALLRPGPWLSDASGTQHWQPDLLARCMCTSDVQAAVAWAAAENAALRALLSSNAPSLATSGDSVPLAKISPGALEAEGKPGTAAAATAAPAGRAAPLWTVRPLGTAHSWSSYGAGKGVQTPNLQASESHESYPASKRRRVLCLDLSGLAAGPATIQAMPPTWSKSSETNRKTCNAVVTIGASAHVSALADVALAHGYSVASLPMLHAQTLGGAIAVGSHGSSLREGTLSDQVAGLSMVIADSSLVHLGYNTDLPPATDMTTCNDGTSASAEWSNRARSAGNDQCSEGEDLLLRCARVAVGTLGIITHVSMWCEPARYVVKRCVETHVPVATWTAAVASWSNCEDSDGPFGCAEHAMAVWCLGQSELAMCCLETAEADGYLETSTGGEVETDGEYAQGRCTGGGSSSISSSIGGSSSTHFGVYNGRNWFGGSYGSDFVAPGAAPPRTEKEVTAQGLVWQSLQYSFPVSKLERTVMLLSAATEPSNGLSVHSGESLGDDSLESLLRGRVVEFKFLRCSDAALLGPNSFRRGTSTDSDNTTGSAENTAEAKVPSSAAAAAAAIDLAFAVNVYWPLPRGDTRALTALEFVLRAVGGGKPHWGKHHSPYEVSKALPDTCELRSPGLLQGWLKAFPKTTQDSFEHTRRNVDPEGLLCTDL